MMKPTNYSERIQDLGGWKVRVTSYMLEDTYYCKVDNLEPGATIARSKGSTEEEAREKALSRAESLLSKTRRFDN